MRIRAFITHKKAETFVDCQDRFGVNETTKSIAVSDGMSQSWQQKRWAQLLVDAYTESEDWIPSQESIKPLCGRWHKQVVEYIDYLKNTNAKENIIYRNERNLAEGRSAGATFVGIRFYGLEWKGHVLGDSCLIEWNGNNATFYTSQNVDSFDNHPDYFDSNILNEGKGTPISICGILENNTCLLLVSDPFSDFLIEHKKQGDVTEYMQQLQKISSHDEFEKLVDEWRYAGMHNDDTTLVIVEPDDSDAFSTDVNTLDDINNFIDEEKRLVEKKQKEKEEQIAAPVSTELTGKDTEQIATPVSTELIENDTEQISTPISNVLIECGKEPDINAVVDKEKQEEQSEKHSESNLLIFTSDKSTREFKEDKGEKPELVPVETSAFVDELLAEYKKESSGIIDSFKFTITEEAVKRAGYAIFRKYNIFNK